MAVQMATSANDLAQVCAPAKTAMVSGDEGAAFKNILQGMRESRQKTAQTAPKTQKAGKEPKTPVNFAFLAGEECERGANPDETAAVRSAEPEMTQDEEVTPPSRFDPDVFLGALQGAVTDKPDKRGADTAKDAEEDRPARPAGENKAQLAALAETNGTTEADIKKLYDQSTGHPAHDETDALAEANGKIEADVKKISDAAAQSDGTKELAAKDVSRGIKPNESLVSGTDKLPDANTDENTKITGHETSFDGEKIERGIDGKNEPGVSKTAPRTSDTVHAASGQEDTSAEKSAPEMVSSKKLTQERDAEPQVPAVNLPSGQTRAEVPQPVQPPAVYTLMPGDKFGNGLRSVLTIMTRDGGTEARIVVEPPALGRVDISLRSSESGVEANFKVDNEELKQMVQKQLDSLKESLNAQGIHVSGMTVDIKNNEGGSNRGNTAAKKGRRTARPLDEAGEDAEDGTRVLRLDLEKGLLHWVA
ncbi:MAG: flagellar hook-length control protein FliK [Synergistaceae bacterium]|jgi:flagellar hook-length control protein FliK|nr:flagellar hook-length control protein FliK [Synergistaceae bacterium]